MKLFFAIVLTFFSSFSQAAVMGSITGESGDALLLKDDVCENTPFHQFIVQDKTAKTMQSGCWFIHGSTVVLLTVDGQVGVMDGMNFEWNEVVQKTNKTGHES